MNVIGGRDKADVDKGLPLQEEVNLDILIDLFCQNNDVQLRQLIANLPYLERLFSLYVRDHPNLTMDQFKEIFFQHEKAFVDHIITRLVTILNEARDMHDLDGDGVIFNIQTSMLYDVDETLSLIDFGIRPSAKLLFDFIKLNLKKIKIGIISTRGQEYLDKQIVDANVRGSLTEISSSLDFGAVGICAVGGFLGFNCVNPDKFDPRIYPRWQPLDLKYILMTQFSFSEEDADRFIEDDLPVFKQACVKESVLRFPQLSFEFGLGDEVSKVVRRCMVFDSPIITINKPPAMPV